MKDEILKLDVSPKSLDSYGRFTHLVQVKTDMQLVGEEADLGYTYEEMNLHAFRDFIFRGRVLLPGIASIADQSSYFGITEFPPGTSLYEGKAWRRLLSVPDSREVPVVGVIVEQAISVETNQIEVTLRRFRKWEARQEGWGVIDVYTSPESGSYATKALETICQAGIEHLPQINRLHVKVGSGCEYETPEPYSLFMLGIATDKLQKKLDAEEWAFGKGPNVKWILD